MRRYTEIPRNNLWFGERGCLLVWLTNQQPIRFLQLSFPLYVSLPGTGPGRWIHSRIRKQRYNLFSKNQKFRYNFLIFFHFFSFCPQDSGRNPVYLHTGTPKINRYACYESPRRLSFRPNWKGLPDKSPSGSPSPRNLRIRIQGETRANKKEIGNTRIFPIFALSFTIVSPTTVFDRPGRIIRAGVYCLSAASIRCLNK